MRYRPLGILQRVQSKDEGLNTKAPRHQGARFPRRNSADQLSAISFLKINSIQLPVRSDTPTRVGLCAFVFKHFSIEYHHFAMSRFNASAMSSAMCFTSVCCPRRWHIPLMFIVQPASLQMVTWVPVAAMQLTLSSTMAPEMAGYLTAK